MLWIEWAVLFITFPVIAYCDIISAGKHFILALPVLYGFLVYGLTGREKARRENAKPKHLLLRIALITIAIFLFSYVIFPESFLEIPRKKFRLWLMIMAFYPWLSALPQEFLYRRFYFWRYEHIFKKKWYLISTSVLTFSFLHIMYDNILAILFTLLGGWLFATVYAKSRTLTIPFFEHAIYGLAIFTSGLGRFFYEPIMGIS